MQIDYSCAESCTYSKIGPLTHLRPFKSTINKKASARDFGIYRTCAESTKSLILTYPGGGSRGLLLIWVYTLFTRSIGFGEYLQNRVENNVDPEQKSDNLDLHCFQNSIMVSFHSIFQGECQNNLCIVSIFLLWFKVRYWKSLFGMAKNVQCSLRHIKLLCQHLEYHKMCCIILILFSHLLYSSYSNSMETPF